MIGYIHGTIISKQVPIAVINVHGLGYEVETSMTTFFRLPEPGETVSLHTHFTVREDAQILYGFHDESERSLFRILIKVNGVGPKLALAILSSIEAESFVACVQCNDTATLVRIPGVGKKTAERLVIEMRDRLQDWTVDESMVTPGEQPIAVDQNALVRDAISALVSLGYKPQQASQLLRNIDTENKDVEHLVKDALKEAIA